MEKRLGVYIHIPFCASKCAYCDFYSRAGCDEWMPQYQAAVIRHIRESASQLEGYLIDTVYFGGGTPSYFGAGRIISIFNALKKYGRVLLDAEVTMEANPDSIRYVDLVRLRNAGVNRLSLGVQCADDGLNKSIGRRHTFSQAQKAVEEARRAGFENISLDLIYALPSQTRDDWAETLKRTVALRPDHLSCYCLKIEEGTPLYLYKDSPFIPDEDAQADMYLYTVETLAKSGYYQYEISNFAMRGKQSRHNLKYWQGEEYMAFGAAAHAYVGGERYSNIPDIQGYIEAVKNGDSLVDSIETITKYEQASEYLMLGLRTVRGISEKEYRDIYPCLFDKITQRLEFFRKNGWAERSGDRWNLTPQGFLVSNTLIADILDAHTRQRAAVSRLEDEDPSQMEIYMEEQMDTRLFMGIN